LVGFQPARSSLLELSNVADEPFDDLIRKGNPFDTIRKVDIERFSVTSSKPFDQVLAAIDSGIGHPNMAEFESPLARHALLPS
jgi:hypothetical protein